jgi:maltose O-acetyltransferase
MKMTKLKRILYEELWSFYQWIFLFIPGRIGHYTRGFFLKIFFKKAGKKITIKENVEIYHSENLIIGNNSGFGRNNIIDCIGGVEIGDNVRIGPSVMIATMNHTTIKDGMQNKKRVLKKVVLKNNIWVGHNVTILPGVTIGNNCIIAAGSVVTKSFDDNSVIAGVPARRIN